MLPFLSRLSSKTKRRTRSRREDRFDAATLHSNLGSVVDLSGQGARIRRTAKPPLEIGQVFWLTLLSKQCHITLESRVVRIRREGPRRFDIGLEFLNASDALRQQLRNLAQHGVLALPRPKSTLRAAG